MASRILQHGRSSLLYHLPRYQIASRSAFPRLYSIKPKTLDTSTPSPKAGIEQDHHYTPSTGTSSKPPTSSDELSVRQHSSKARTLPDGTIPETGASGSTQDSSIPSVTTETPDAENLDEINAEVFHSRRARALGNNAPGMKPAAAGTPKDAPAGVNNPEFSTTSSKVKETTSEVVDELKTSPNSPLNTKPYAINASAVPSSQLGRLFHYGGLAAGMTFGAMSESIRRVTGGNDASKSGGIVMNPQNIERLVKTLSKMRGAALKLGQMLSLQDSTFLPPAIQIILSRVQNQADHMPPSQRDSVLAANLGPEWRSLFTDFEETPIAAASIGQVHTATLASTGQKVAIKVQYPGVARSISSDLNNLSILLTATRLLPKGLYLDKTIANARTELAWECDYVREAASQTKFKQIISSSPSEAKVFSVPAVISEASGPEVLTMEYMTGTPVARISQLSQEEKDWLGSQILRLCLLEIGKWGFMQTDPNWSNFLYNRRDRKIKLLDFGASREYPKEFITDYVNVLKAASVGDAPTIRDLSIKLGYLNGLESQEMLKAHITSILTLAEPFSKSAPEVYDFGKQTVTDRVKALIPVMVRERLRPPPEETYSLHRKLSGAFLLCARLESKVRAREMFEDVVGSA